jgi:hypothetical protein
MEKFLIYIIMGCFSLTSAFGQNKLDGIYVGLDPMCSTLKNGRKACYTDHARPNRKWFHLTYLKIQGDLVFADQNPISIYKKDTSYSASDGAFYYYHGHININDTIAIIKMQLVFCDYCAMPEKDNPNAYHFPFTKNYLATLTSKGLLINGYLFTKTNKKGDLVSEHTRSF